MADGAPPRSTRWFSSRRRRIRVEAYIVLGSLLTILVVMLAAAGLEHLFGYVVGGAAYFTMGVVVFTAAFAVFFAMSAIFAEVFFSPQEDDASEREVARIVSGRSPTRPEAAADPPSGPQPVLAGSNHWRPPEPLAGVEEARLPRSFIQPTRIERHALPISSLPFEWLQITRPLPRRGAVSYLDGVSMLLELALRGFVDVPTTTARGDRPRSGSTLVVGAEAADNPALDGALGAIRGFGSPLDAQSAAIRLAPYVEALVVPDVGAAAGRERLREAIVADGATDIRAALLVWMLKQDLVFGGFTSAAIFPSSTGVTRRALRRAGPELYALADHDVAATAHRVLFALFRMPSFPTA